MKNFKLTATLKSKRPTSSGSYVYLLTGSKEALKFFEENYDIIKKDESTGQFLFFKKKLWLFGAELVFVEDLEQPFQLEPSAKSLLAQEIMREEMSLESKSSSSSSSKKDESDEEEDDDADLEAPVKKPSASTVKKKGLK